MSCALPCTWWCCTIEPVWAPPRKLRTKSLSYVCSGLFRKPNPLFCFICGIRVASMTSVDSMLFLNGVLILLCEYQSFSIIGIVMSILFQLACFSSSGSDHFNFRKINYHFFSTVFVSSVSKLPLVFPAHPPFFLKDSDFLIKYPFYWWEVSPFFSINILIQWFSGRY